MAPLARFLVALTLLLLAAGCRDKASPTSLHKDKAQPVLEDDDVPTNAHENDKGALAVVSLVHGEVRLDGKRRGTVADLVSADRVTKLQSLFDDMEGRRVAFQQRDPGRYFPGAFLLRSEPKVVTLAIKSVVDTASEAGFVAPTIVVGRRRIPVISEFLPAFDIDLTKKPTLYVTIKKETASLVTRTGGIDVARMDVPLGNLSQGVRDRIAATAVQRVVLYVPHDITFEHFGTQLTAVADALGDGSAPEIVFSVAQERPIPSDGETSDSPSGRIDPSEIRRIVRKAYGNFRRCYLAAKLPGKIKVSFVIARDGTVSSVSTSGMEAVASVGTCIARHFRRLVFPKPKGGVVKVVYPIVFSPD